MSKLEFQGLKGVNDKLLIENKIIWYRPASTPKYK